MCLGAALSPAHFGSVGCAGRGTDPFPGTSTLFVLACFKAEGIQYWAYSGIVWVCSPPLIDIKTHSLGVQYKVAIGTSESGLREFWWNFLTLTALVLMELLVSFYCNRIK